ncbi:protein HUA2-LIKE 2-like isoform X2 [Senna tora]|uniref:Protein HUA2-LIKE 2-like isoform X2 n=1 Tax=Senna tora TaxID=362788 RepID=A0A834SIH3_9FABA|nr:protein HUA2-LIKE 2-like isoform X2 [Senna tora]
MKASEFYHLNCSVESSSCRVPKSVQWQAPPEKWWKLIVMDLLLAIRDQSLRVGFPGTMRGNARANILAKHANELHLHITYQNMPSFLSTQFLADQVGWRWVLLMAPSRRKGANKAAAAAAARRQWKVGDLVLAKVKGFPAWPATVSEPERWGYTRDWKKVVVYFFGTQQIAFCNPADVEAFTEEKKQYLLRRPGKGADFVRAVQEIIDSYEKLKRESQLDENNSCGEVTGADVSNEADLSAEIGLKDETEAPDLTLNQQMKSSVSVTDRHGPICAAADNASATALSPSREDASLEEPNDNSVAIVKSPFPVTYSSRKRSADWRPQGYITQSVVPVRRSRSLSKVLPFNDSGKCVGNISATAAQSVSVRWNKRFRKSPDLSGCDDIDSSGLASNGSIEDNGSEIFTIDSDTFSLNEGSTIDSNSKHDHSETIECLAGEVDLKNGLDLEIKAMASKKKRKPNRKRATNDVAKLTNTPDEAASLLNTSQSSQNTCEHLKESCSEQDGDEHLPLLKRARVRMGKSLSTETEPNSILQDQEKRSKEDIINSLPQMVTSSKSENGSLPDGDSSLFNGEMDNVSPSKNLAPCSESELQTSKKDQTLGCSLDGEAALPPSKRLHRALEAMSANVAEEGQACKEASSAIMTSSGFDLQGVDSCGNDSCHINVHSFSACSNPIISSVEVDKQLIKFHNHEICNDAFPGTKDQVCRQTAGTDSQIQLCAISPPNIDTKCCEVGSTQDSPGPSLLPNDEDSIKTVDLSNKASDSSEHTEMSLDIASGVNESGKFSSQNSTDVPLNRVVASEDTECLKLVGDRSKANDTSCDVVKEVKCKGLEEDVNSASFSDDCLGEKGILGLRSSSSLTDGGDCLPQGSPPNMSVCNVSTSDSSNVLQNNGSCSPDVHLHRKQSLSVPVVDEQNNRSAATQKSRSTGKSTEAGHAALLYFEAMLGTLTRTKESIGRATRIAIDCAKFGNAVKDIELMGHEISRDLGIDLAKRLHCAWHGTLSCFSLKSTMTFIEIELALPFEVVEILVHSLETESSLHRRVDLFFLVDSITQCSRGLKGDVGGVYPSAIQAVLPRLLSAAAPPGSTAQENPSRRTLRTERALHDPVREMEGMLVDEYGSNSSFQLPGFCMPRMLKDEDDEGSDSDGGNFEAVTPEHDSKTHDGTAVIHAVEKHRHILEDVDGELEMEDVAPSHDVEMNLVCKVDGGNAAESSHNQAEKSLPLSFGPPLPQDMPISSPPLPPSPPPPPPPPPPHLHPHPHPHPPSLHLIPTGSDSYGTSVDSKLYTDAQIVQVNSFHSMVQPLAPPRSKPVSEAVHYRVPECGDMQMPVSESTCSFSNFPVPPPDNFRHSGTVHNRGYPLRPPHHVPSSQFSFVCGEQHVKPQREVPPPLYSNRHHTVHSMERENFYNNHERLKPPSFDYQERWRGPASYTGHPYQDRGVPPTNGCHPCESSRLPGHGWRYPPRSMNHSNSVPFRPPFEDAISVTSRAVRSVFQVQAFGSQGEKKLPRQPRYDALFGLCSGFVKREVVFGPFFCTCKAFV